MNETSRKMIRAEFVTCVEAEIIPHTILLTNEEKRPLRRPQIRGISGVWNRRVRIGFLFLFFFFFFFFTLGSNYFFESDKKHFDSIKYSKLLRK
jgi:hypothetical protein